MKKQKIVLLCMVALLCACNSDPDTTNYDWQGMVGLTSPDVDVRFAHSMAYNDTAASRDIMVPGEDYRVYVMADTHVDTTTYNLDRIIRDANQDDACRLVLHLGDLINSQNHYPRYDASAKKCTKPLYAAVGNHDLYFNQWAQFRQFYGTSAYTFTVTTPSGVQDLYICMDSGSGTVGAKQMKWLRRVLKEAKEEHCRHIFLYTHTHIFKQDNSQRGCTNYALEETYELLGLMQQYGVEMVLMGHDHWREITNYGGVCYIIVDTAKDPEEKAAYMVLHVGEQLGYEFRQLPQKLGGY